MKNFVVVYALMVILISITTGNPVKKHKIIVELYSSEDQVEVLSADDFEKKIQNSTHDWFIKFYLSWCGHCQRLSFIWKDFARDIFAWKDLVQVAAIDCADEHNTDVCREQKVTHYPTLKYFPVNSSSIDVEIPESEENVNSIRHHFLDRIVEEISEGRSQTYPNILPYQDSDFEKLFDGVPDTTKYFFLVVEPPGLYLGAEVAMDLHKTPNVVIRHAFTNNTDLIQKLPIQEHPSVVVVDTNNNVHSLPGTCSSRQEIKESIVKFLQKKGIEVVMDVAPEKKNTTRNLTISEAENILYYHVKSMGDVSFQKDLEAALRYSLKQEVAVSETITDEKLDALVDYLNILQKYFPFGYKAQPFMDELINLTSSEPLEGYKVAEVVKRAEENGIFSAEEGYLGCQGSSPRFRGYTCTLWKLFHYLTVNAEDEQNPGEVLETMLRYVKNFFGCEDCSRHFQEMASRRHLTQVSTLNDSILALWTAHNEVNRRLKFDSTEDPDFPKEQFPTHRACPRCINEDSSWNEKEVLVYLKNMYGKYNVRYLGADTKVLFEALQ